MKKKVRNTESIEIPEKKIVSVREIYNYRIKFLITENIILHTKSTS